MIIAVGTENAAKVGAVHEIIDVVFPKTEHVFKTHSVESGVRPQPLDDNETIQGALNRASKAAALTPGTDLAIGLEGGVQETAYGMFLRGWVVVIDVASTEIYYGHSGGMLVPDSIADRLRAGEELGPVIQALYPEKSSDIRQSMGTGGILTDGMYVRQREFEDALRCALGSLRVATS